MEERKRKKKVVVRERGGRRRTNITLIRTIITINETNTTIN
jgi:hypothetical protein